LIGTSSNRDAIGAVVRTGSQWNQMTSSAGYASSSLAPVHFGLGQQSVISELTIEWPSGIVQKLTHVKADQRLVIREPSR
jgi:enediyne biosynthesis protein E4